MAINTEAYKKIKNITDNKNVILVAVSKTKPMEDIQELYDLGQRDFGENYVQELVDKYEVLPKDIRWHFIGHLQSNKVKYIAPFVHLIHGVDSEKLLAEINKQGAKNNRKIDCLLQVHIAEEETKFGFDEAELKDLTTRIIHSNYTNYPNVSVRGLMGMASFSDDLEKVKTEFQHLNQLFSNANLPSSGFNLLSMGMSGDYEIALNEGSNMIRIGSLLFGERNYPVK
jgi:pyridoxal phosphate enzyme (YggS family)